MDDVLRWAPQVAQIAPLYAITPTLVLAVIAKETGWAGNADLVMPAPWYATGLMQVLPREAGPMFAHRPSIEALKDPETNLRWGCFLLAGYLRRHGSPIEALYHYSGGEAEWAKHGGRAAYEARYWRPLHRAWWRIEMALASQNERKYRRFDQYPYRGIKVHDGNTR